MWTEKEGTEEEEEEKEETEEEERVTPNHMTVRSVYSCNPWRQKPTGETCLTKLNKPSQVKDASEGLFP